MPSGIYDDCSAEEIARAKKEALAHLRFIEAVDAIVQCQLSLTHRGGP